MARADSTVRVNIIGDAKSLQKAAKDSDKSFGKISSGAKAAGAILAGAFAIDKILDFSQSALTEADRIGDATTRLEEQLGDLSQPIEDAAGSMEDLGQSRQDVLELAARFSDIGTAAGIADEKLAPMAVTASEAAAALSLITDMDAATILDLIGKAGSGATKPLKELGISISDAEVEARALRDTGKESADALTDGELAAARQQIVLEKLAPRVAEVTGAEADLETQQRTLQAKFETFTGIVGDAVDGPLTDLLTLLIDIGEQAGTAASNIQAGSKVIRGELNKIQGPLRTVIDLFRTLVDLAAIVSPAAGLARQSGFGSGGTSGPVGSPGSPHPGVTLNVQGGSPEVVEQAVKDALRSLSGKGPTSGSGT